MSTPKDVEQLMPIVLRGLADLLETHEERLPAGLSGLLQNFGSACFEKGVESAHEAITMPSPDERPTKRTSVTGKTNPSFPPAPEHLPPPPRVPTIFTQETRRPPKSSRVRKNSSRRGDKNSE